jgi:septal ring factor EnvC (AmiA/AmiB activator)
LKEGKIVLQQELANIKAELVATKDELKETKTQLAASNSKLATISKAIKPWNGTDSNLGTP